MVKEIITICDNPTIGTWGSHQLLLKEYKETEFIEGLEGVNISEINKSQRYLLKIKDFQQMLFNVQWLESMFKKYGELHCEYCGKKGLVICKWNEAQLPNMATTDHFYPRKTHSHLSRDIKNFIVSCRKCNENKKAKVFSKDSIKYPYPCNNITLGNV